MKLPSIQSYLQKLTLDSPVSYCPNPGNGGDALITQATIQMFRTCGIQYQVIDPRQWLPADKVVIYGGGGNLCHYYNDARAFIQRIHRDVRKLIILPHTITGNEDLLAALGSNVDIICRETVSYQHVQRHSNRANVFLTDDMAFSLPVKKVLQARLRRPWHITPVLTREAIEQHRPDAVRAYLRTRYTVNRTGILHAFRTDCEATTKQLPKHNYDLSFAFNYGTANEYSVLLASVHILRLVNACRQLQTDRLHIAIAGALLGREVLFYANNYYKNQAIYDFSIKARFPHVHWMSTRET